MQRSHVNNSHNSRRGKPNNFIPVRLSKFLQPKLDQEACVFPTFTRKRQCQKLQVNDNMSSQVILRNAIDLCNEEEVQKRTLPAYDQQTQPAPLEGDSIEKAKNKIGERDNTQDTLDALKMSLVEFRANSKPGAEQTPQVVNIKTSSQDDVQIQRTKQEQTKIDDWTRNALNKVLVDFSYHEDKSDICKFPNEEEIFGDSNSSCYFNDESHADDGDISLCVTVSSERTSTTQNPWKDEDLPGKCDNVDTTYVPFPVERRRRQLSSNML
eukprot:CAMPEP_0195508718 /NCGR_PEP_ID=MMETSP0794_2-20130614/1853_1 /TAXON_ID=515487 /ORGANISM="Stephanopyxis turris, Strain CCMP 815" /LENGTH=267 /DNA_ID=CAMNT_0040635747 /DNA_START=111 /DNA_END=914 /DNA_ORIENTATION=-